MDSRRKFISQVASGLAGSIATSTAGVLGASDRIRVGIIGAGDRGMELIPQIRACQNAEVTAVADIVPSRLDRISDIVRHTDYRRILDDRTIDAVIIATPPHLHAAQFCSALDAGKHVYVERVMAFSVDHAKRMRAAFQQDGGKRTVQVGHQACSFGQMADVRQFLNEPERLGSITAISMQMHRNAPWNKPQSARPTLLTPDLNAETVAWEEFLGDAPPLAFDRQRLIHWRYFWDYSGGNVFEGLSQQLSFWYKALDLQIPYSASMDGGVFLSKDGREVPDTASVTLDQPEQMLVTWMSSPSNGQLGITEDVLGTHGTISRSSQVRYTPQKVNRPAGTEMLGRSSHVPHAHMADFFDSIRLSKQPNAPFELGYRVSIACRMAVDSFRAGRRLYWDAAKEVIV